VFLVEKAKSLLERFPEPEESGRTDDGAEPMTGGGALSGTVPSIRDAGVRDAGVRDAGVRDAGVRDAGAEDGQPDLPRASTTGTRLKPVESGVFSGLTGPVSGEQLVDSLQSALNAASRGEAGLGSLHRSVRDASRSLTSLRHAHESLADELRVMYRGLNEVMSEKTAVERYAALLTQERDSALDAAEDARREAKREREFLLREQDRFIQLLLEEHEAELQQVRRAVSGRTSAPPPVGLAFSLSPQPPVVLGKVEPALAFRVSSTPADAKTPTVPARALESVEPAETAHSSGFRPVTQLARVQLVPSSDRPPAQDGERSLAERSVTNTLRSEVPEDEEHSRTYPPAPAVVDLDSLAAEVEGNSERPPPIRRIGLMEPALYLKPARVPTALLDTLVSKTGDESDDQG
jgi:hypothetical protein